MLSIRHLLFSEIVVLWHCEANRLLVMSEIDGSAYLHKVGCGWLKWTHVYIITITIACNLRGYLLVNEFNEFCQCKIWSCSALRLYKTFVELFTWIFLFLLIRNHYIHSLVSEYLGLIHKEIHKYYGAA